MSRNYREHRHFCVTNRLSSCDESTFLLWRNDFPFVTKWLSFRDEMTFLWWRSDFPLVTKWLSSGDEMTFHCDEVTFHLWRSDFSLVTKWLNGPWRSDFSLWRSGVVTKWPAPPGILRAREREAGLATAWGTAEETGKELERGSKDGPEPSAMADCCGWPMLTQERWA